MDSFRFAVSATPLFVSRVDACSAALAECRPRTHALAASALAAVRPEAAADLNQAAARAAAAAPLAVQLLRGRDGDDCGSDLGDEPFAAAAGQVPQARAAK